MDRHTLFLWKRVQVKYFPVSSTVFYAHFPNREINEHSLLTEPYVGLNIWGASQFISREVARQQNIFEKRSSVPSAPIQPVLQFAGNLAKVTEHWPRFFKYTSDLGYRNDCLSFPITPIQPVLRCS